MYARAASNYYSQDKDNEVFLHLVLEYMPSNLYSLIKDTAKHHQLSSSSNSGIRDISSGSGNSSSNGNTVILTESLIRTLMQQLLAALAYIHDRNICHRDIKPQNILVDAQTARLKLCDFGSAKTLVAGEPSISYICSRFYRAPEVIFGSSNYSVAIDVWSVGCVMAEMFLGRPLFVGSTSLEQLVEIVRVLGTPSAAEVMAMNPDCMPESLPVVKHTGLAAVFQASNNGSSVDGHVGEDGQGEVNSSASKGSNGTTSSAMMKPCVMADEKAIKLMARMLDYDPKKRITAKQALQDPYFAS